MSPKFSIRITTEMTAPMQKLFKYSQTCLMWPSKGTVKFGHIRQMVA